MINRLLFASEQEPGSRDVRAKINPALLRADPPRDPKGCLALAQVIVAALLALTCGFVIASIVHAVFGGR